jgi:hypothetical protein
MLYQRGAVKKLNELKDLAGYYQDMYVYRMNGVPVGYETAFFTRAKRAELRVLGLAKRWKERANNISIRIVNNSILESVKSRLLYGEGIGVIKGLTAYHKECLPGKHDESIR